MNMQKYYYCVLLTIVCEMQKIWSIDEEYTDCLLDIEKREERDLSFVFVKIVLQALFCCFFCRETDNIEKTINLHGKTKT